MKERLLKESREEELRVIEMRRAVEAARVKAKKKAHADALEAD